MSYFALKFSKVVNFGGSALRSPLAPLHPHTSGDRRLLSGSLPAKIYGSAPALARNRKKHENISLTENVNDYYPVSMSHDIPMFCPSFLRFST